MFRSKFLALIAGAGLAVAIAGTAAASVSPHVIIGTGTSEYVAGYQVNGNDQLAFNDVRYTARPVQGSSTSPCIALQTEVNGGQTAALCLLATAPDTWTLEGFVGIASLPYALAHLTVVPSIAGDDITINGGDSYYLEIHYSTLHNLIAFDAGPSEFGDVNVLAQFPMSDHSLIFYAPFAGGVNLDPSSLPSGTQVAFTRVGLTELLDPSAPAGGTNGRVTYSKVSVLEYEATQNGGPAGAGNPVVLQPTGFGTGSAFSLFN
jgi:hypothetical protein